MAKQYISNAFLQVEDNQVYSIFAWSQKPAALIRNKSWLVILEIFTQPHSLATAFQSFQDILCNAIALSSSQEINKYRELINNTPNCLVFLAVNELTIYGKGFRSFIEKEMQFNLLNLRSESTSILLNLFPDQSLIDDLKQVNSLETFTKIFQELEALGLVAPAKDLIDWGDLKRFAPICQAFGLTRGTPVDRYYLSQFIQEIKPQIKGQILEVGGTPKDKDFYQVNLGDSYQVMNIEAGPGVDIVGDVHNSQLVASNSFDSVIIFNVLEHCYAPWIAVENIYKWLKPGGKCFAMVPNGIRVHATPRDYWRPLPDAMAWIFKGFSQQKLYVYGNPITVLASYYGIATEELTQEELDQFHPDYPVATCIVAEK